MIKIVYVVSRRDDIAPKDFYAYWLDSHGPRVRGHASAIHARRYVQSHLIDTPLNRGMQESRGVMEPAAGITGSGGTRSPISKPAFESRPELPPSRTLPMTRRSSSTSAAPRSS
jgi:EthD domain-containing protein